jgi:hypothetical protein
MKSNCYHKEGHQYPCSYSGNLYMLLFGLVQIVMSFIPDLHNMAWVSVVAALMSFTYSFIGLGLGISTVISKARLHSIFAYLLLSPSHNVCHICKKCLNHKFSP